MSQAEIVDSSSRAAARRPIRSLRKSINDKCRECIYDPKSGTGNWRQQVDACTSYSCPLYPVRPRSEHGRSQVCMAGEKPDLITCAFGKPPTFFRVHGSGRRPSPYRGFPMRSFCKSPLAGVHPKAAADLFFYPYSRIFKRGVRA